MAMTPDDDAADDGEVIQATCAGCGEPLTGDPALIVRVSGGTTAWCEECVRAAAGLAEG